MLNVLQVLASVSIRQGTFLGTPLFVRLACLCADRCNS